MENLNTKIAAPRQIPAGCTKKEYRRSYASEELYKQLKSVAVWGYALIGLNVAVGLFVNTASLLDAAFLLVMVLLMHKKRMKGGVIAILVYSAIGTVLSLLNSGRVTGWMWYLLCFCALRIFKQMDQEYEAAKANTPEL